MRHARHAGRMAAKYFFAAAADGILYLHHGTIDPWLSNAADGK